MIRISILLLAGGIFVIVHGCDELKLTRHSTPEPVKVELAQIESGKRPESAHITVGDHWSVYSRAIYSYTRDKSETGKPGQGTRVTHAFYPVISEDHPFWKELHRLEQQFGSFDKIPQDQRPKLDTCSMLIKTERFPTIGSIPGEWKKEGALTGLVINEVSPLDTQERDLVRHGFPSFDPDKVLVLEDNRHPHSYLYSLAMFVLGPVLMVLAAGIFMRRSR